MVPFPKRYGKQMPLLVDNGERICFKMAVPDQLEYRAALMGQLIDLGYWFTWDHTQADFSNIPEKNQQVAELWVQIVADASFEVCMDICAQIIACITTDSDVQAAFRDFIINDPAINQHIVGVAEETALSLAERGKNILKPDECNPDYIFNQASVLVQLLHDVTEDIFEAVEVGTNRVERAQLLVSGIPGIGLGPFDEILDFADQLVEEIQEDYSGAYDEALFDVIRCKIFCACKDDCTLSLDRVISVYEELFVQEIPTDPFDAFWSVISYLETGDLPTDAPVYGMHLLVLTAMRLSQTVFGIDFTTMALRVIAAGDDPDNDWEILCEDCPPVGDRTPVINSVWDAANFGGSLSGPDGDGIYTATTTLRGSGVGYGFALMDIDGRDFVLTDIVYSSPPQCQIFVLNESPFYIACTDSNAYTGQTCDEFHTTQESATPTTMQFKMVAP